MRILAGASGFPRLSGVALASPGGIPISLTCFTSIGSDEFNDVLGLAMPAAPDRLNLGRVG
jgi:hypothetical protein